MGKEAAGLPEIFPHREARRRAAEGDFSGILNWEEGREMEASGLVDIQSHTHFHREYFSSRDGGERLDPLRAEALSRDLQQSKSLIESRLRKTCRYLAWPWGKYDPEAVALARKAGFEGIATTAKGVNVPGADGSAIKRIVAKSGDKRWFANRYWIYSHPRIGQWYSRVVGKL
jgi:peptidoglycan/xylan/chitin deacetylase (PgdA/CDA1 family)